MNLGQEWTEDPPPDSRPGAGPSQHPSRVLPLRGYPRGVQLVAELLASRTPFVARIPHAVLNLFDVVAAGPFAGPSGTATATADHSAVAVQGGGVLATAVVALQDKAGPPTAAVSASVAVARADCRTVRTTGAGAEASVGCTKAKAPVGMCGMEIRVVGS